MVDVFNSTHKLEQTNNQQVNINHRKSRNTRNNEGPLWNYFWNSLSSQQSEEPMNITENNTSPHPSNSLLKLSTDVRPEESVSVTHNNRKKRPSHINSDTFFTFKFTSHKHQTYRILCRPKLVDLMNAIHSKVKDGDTFSIVSYLDDEQDQVFISGDTDLEDAVYQAIKSGQTCVKLVIQNQNLERTNTLQADETKSTASSLSSSLVLPSVISLFGIVVTVVFICSRTSNQ